MQEIYKQNIKKLLIFLLCLYASLFIIKIFFIKDDFLSIANKIVRDRVDKFPKRNSFLYDYFLYMSLAFTFLPLPTIPTVILMGKTFSPMNVALIGAVATTLANLNDYLIVSTMFLSQKVQKIHQSSFYKFLIKNFERHSFLIISFGSFIPISIDVIRLLAISNQYPILKFSLANFVGRFPRYFLLAFLGYSFQISNIWILIIFIIFLIVSFFIQKTFSKQEKG